MPYIVRYWRPLRGTLWHDSEFDTLDGAVLFARATRRNHPSRSVVLFAPALEYDYRYAKRTGTYETLCIKHATPEGIVSNYYVEARYS